jgi:SAM-dependent methyltransferase
MNRETNKLVSSIEPQPKRVLEISGNGWSSYGFEEYLSVVYPAFDICTSRLPEKFDLIIAEQVWEHLRFPYAATKNVISMLNPGGHFLITVPFLVKYHPMLFDCTRWSAEGLKFFLKECGFELQNIKVGSWGNRECVIDNLSGWKEYKPQEHSLKNQSNFPYHVWALAKFLGDN